MIIDSKELGKENMPLTFKTFVSLIPSNVSFSTSARSDVKDMSLFKKNFENGNIKDINASDVNGWTFLHYAAIRDNSEAIRFLVNHGANMELKTSEEKTPLYLAAIMENIEAVKTLVELGANIDVRDSLGNHLLYNVEHKHNDKLKEILKLEEMKKVININENPKFERIYKQNLLKLMKENKLR
ncbi:MAG: ankyrin repeat domain-containing protein [bacterium]|nr:ankyrin repeat domain-containing protein [bacterium]